MGNEQGREGGLGRNWRHVSPSLIRNEHTNELIQQDALSFPNPDLQQFATQLLTKRIRLQHPHILKLIYFQPSSSLCSCSVNGNSYRIIAYTQYAGDSLTDYLAINPPPFRGPCPCQAIIQAAAYLQQFYGFFEVNEEKVFMGLQQQGSETTVKVWVNAGRAECEPERVCSQREMIVSLANLYSFINNNGFCRTISNQDNLLLRDALTLSQLKADIFSLHKVDFPQRERKKSSSLMDNRRSSRKDTPMEDFEEEKMDVIRMPKPTKEQYRYQSTPHTIQSHSHHDNVKVHFIQPERPATERPTVREVNISPLKPPDRTLSTQNTFFFQANPSIQTVQSQQNQVPLACTQLARKIYFNYSPGVSQLQRPHGNEPLRKHQQMDVENVKHLQSLVPNNQKKVLRPLQNKYNHKPAILFEQNYDTYAVSQNVTKQNSFINSPTLHFEQVRQEKPLQIHPSPLSPLPPLPSPPIPSTLLSPLPSPPPSLPVIEVRQSQISDADKEKVGVQNEQDFTIRQMELPLQQQDTKEYAHLPTTSRSPKRPKQDMSIQPEPINEIIEINLPAPERRSQRLDSYSSSKGGTNRPKLNMSSKNQKLQQYTKEIKQTQESIRQWISQSTGSKKQKKLHQAYTAPIKPLKLPVPPPSDCKEVSSIYNDSEKQFMDGPRMQYRIKTENFEEVYQVGQDKVKMKSYPSQESSSQNELELYEAEIKAEYLRQKQQQRERLKARENQLEEEKKFQIEQKRKIAEKKRKHISQQDRRKVEREEKVEMEKDLQNEKKMIQTEMDDLLRNSAMKQQYKSIREKVKQKKETFAQLKAEAAKILEDCLY